jgi:YVTN family beta-propeller protein
MKNARLIHRFAIAMLGGLVGRSAVPPSPAGPAPEGAWLSPAAVVASPDGRELYLACATAGRVVVFDVAAQRISRSLPVPASPSGLALARDGRTLYVTCAAPDSTVCIVDVAQNRIAGRIAASHTAMAPVLSPDGRTLYVCHRFNDEVGFIDLAARKLTRRVKVAREPVGAAITPDGKFLLVANHLQAGRADLEVVAAAVSVVDLVAGKVAREIALPNGSGLLRDVCVSPDGSHAIVAHQLARFHLPTTQIERGWINTNAVSLLDCRALRLVNTVLLDNIDAGAANPWAAAWSADGRTLFVTHAGTHELSVVDFPALLAKLAALEAPSPAVAPAGYAVAARSAADVPNDLSFLVGVRRRVKAPAADRGPRALALAGGKVYLANYFSDTLTVIDPTAPGRPAISVALHTPPAVGAARRGELLFNDATICFQGWQTCASCHSSDARVDGLNWDNLNDGIGNPKNAKSLLFAHQTPPAMWLSVREDASVAVRAGIRNSMFTVQPEADALAIDEYLQSIDPVPSPHLVRGALSPAARRGEKLFLAKSTGCAECHPPRLFTDLKSYDVGTRGKFDKPTDQFDTPTLIEVWRTAPYLHDGSAATVREVLTTRNRGDTHGHTSQLTPAQIDDLVAYVLSL